MTIQRYFIYRIGGEVRSFYILLGFLAVRILCVGGLFHVLIFFDSFFVLVIEFDLAFTLPNEGGRSTTDKFL